MGTLTAAMIRIHVVEIWWVSDQYIQISCESTVYNRRQSARGLVYLCLLCGSTFMFCYYLLGVDTVVLSWLYAKVCHAFLVSSIFKRRQIISGSTEWTDFLRI